MESSLLKSGGVNLVYNKVVIRINRVCTFCCPCSSNLFDATSLALSFTVLGFFPFVHEFILSGLTYILPVTYLWPGVVRKRER